MLLLFLLLLLLFSQQLLLPLRLLDCCALQAGVAGVACGAASGAIPREG